MSQYTVKKTFSGIGEIEYKVASSRKELEQSFALLYKEYLMRGFILPKYYKSGFRITPHHLVPGAATFIALKDGEVVAACSLFPDSPLGLPMDMAYKKEADKLRKAGRRISEAGCLAIKSELFGRGFFSMFNFNKLEFFFTLFKFSFQYAYYAAKLDDICIVTNPGYMIFRFLPFEHLGEVKYYGYDRVAVKRKAAVLKRLDLRKVEGLGVKKIALRKIFLENRIPVKAFENKFKFSPKELHYFFAEKSDILGGLKEKPKEFVRNSYGLNKKEFNRLIR